MDQVLYALLRKVDSFLTVSWKAWGEHRARTDLPPQEPCEAGKNGLYRLTSACANSARKQAAGHDDKDPPSHESPPPLRPRCFHPVDASSGAGVEPRVFGAHRPTPGRDSFRLLRHHPSARGQSAEPRLLLRPPRERPANSWLWPRSGRACP